MATHHPTVLKSLVSGALVLLALPLLASSQDSRASILTVAERYADHQWRAGEANVIHGLDPDGTQVDTPDVTLGPAGWHPDGRENVGIPYMWGGFSSLEEFDRGVAEGRFAGHVPARETARASRHAVGVDCSGFVSRCWDLPQKQSTRSLGRLCYELTGFDQLLPGDIVNSFDGHVVLFEEFVDPQRKSMRVFEAARLRVKRSTYDVADLKRRGYVPLRYRPLDERWVPMEFGQPSFATAGAPAPGRWQADRPTQILELGEVPNPMADAQTLEWARYRRTEDRGEAATTARMISSLDGSRVTIQTLDRIGEKDLASGGSVARASSAVETLMDFAAFSERPGPLELLASTVERGNYKLGGRSFPARKITAYLEGTITIRHTRYPFTLEIDCVQSDEVPLQGILEASYRAELTWAPDDEGERLVSRTSKTFALLDFGYPPEGTGKR